MSNPSARPPFMPGRARLLGQRGLLRIASLALFAAAFAAAGSAAGSAPAQANAAHASAARVATAAHRVNTRVNTTAHAALRPGENLLRNADGTVGDASARGWDAVTIPGWQIRSGLPTVIRYGTKGFPKAAQPPKDQGNLFVGAAGGTATLVQTTPVTLTRPSNDPASYTISAWLGGTKTSAATLNVRCRDARGAVVATRSIGPVGRQPHPVLRRRSATGMLPGGATSAQVTLTLATRAAASPRATPSSRPSSRRS